jgi:hypothetical protein
MQIMRTETTQGSESTPASGALKATGDPAYAWSQSALTLAYPPDRWITGCSKQVGSQGFATGLNEKGHARAVMMRCCTGAGTILRLQSTDG